MPSAGQNGARNTTTLSSFFGGMNRTTAGGKYVSVQCCCCSLRTKTNTGCCFPSKNNNKKTPSRQTRKLCVLFPFNQVLRECNAEDLARAKSWCGRSASPRDRARGSLHNPRRGREQHINSGFMLLNALLCC